MRPKRVWRVVGVTVGTSWDSWERYEYNTTQESCCRLVLLLCGQTNINVFIVQLDYSITVMAVCRTTVPVQWTRTADGFGAIVHPISWMTYDDGQ